MKKDFKSVVVESNVPTTFEHTITPTWTGILRIGTSCSCAKIPNPQRDCVENQPLTFEFVVTKNYDFTGYIRYYNDHTLISETELEIKTK